jgi:hypothetical protein
VEETRGITVKVRESLHGKASQGAREKDQTMSQFIEMVLEYYFNRGDEKEMAAGKRTLAFQVSEELYAEVQDYVKARGITLKNFGINALRRALDESAPVTACPAGAVQGGDVQADADDSDDGNAERQGE